MIHYRCETPTSIAPASFLLCKTPHVGLDRWHQATDWRFVDCVKCLKARGREINYKTTLPSLQAELEECSSVVHDYALRSKE